MLENKRGLVIAGLLLGALLLAVLAIFRLAGEATAPAAPVPGVAVRELRLGLNIAAGSALHAAAEKFAEAIGQRSQGRLQIKVFPDQVLGSDDQMLEMARNGQLDFVLMPTAKLSSALPAMQYADLPFYFAGRDELYAMLDGEPGQLLLGKLARIDLVGLGFWENGFKQFTANRPIHTPQDFAGLRIRTMKSQLIADQFQSLGAKPIPIDFHATYQALKDGAVDGQENPLVAIVGMRFHEVQKHLTISNHAYLGYVFAASKKVFETLSPEMRDLVQRTVRDLTVWERAETARREAAFIEEIKAAGVEIYTLSPAERERFAAVMAPVADKFSFVVGYDLLAKTAALRLQKEGGEMTGKGRPAAWLIGLDADLSARGAQSGGAIYRGIEMALDDINRKGGLLGAPVRLFALDHGANPAAGRRNLATLAANPAVLAVIGGMHSAVITDELPDIHTLKMPYLIPWAAAQGLTLHEHRPNFTFRVSINDSHVAPFLFDQASRGHRKLGLLFEKSAWGRSNEAALKERLERLPADGYAVARFNTGETEMPAIVDRLVGEGCDALVFFGNGVEAGLVAGAMAKQARPVPIYAHWALVGGDFWGANQAALQKVDLRFAQSVLTDDSSAPHPRLGEFLQHYRHRYGLTAEQPIPSLIGSAHAYDAVHLLALAVGQAQSADREAIRNALERLPPYRGVMKTYRPAFSAQSHDALDRSLLRLARFDARGRIVAAE